MSVAARVLARARAGWAGVLICSSGCAAIPVLSPAHAVHPVLPEMRGLAGLLRTVVVDAGHGGRDEGASHFGLQEKTLALDVAQRLRMNLEAAGVTVVMTRDTDQFIPLSGRPAIANRLQADLFVSVHINANHSHRISGSEVYYPKLSVVTSSAAWPPSVHPADVALPSSSVRLALWDLVLTRARAQSKQLASAICRSLHASLQAPCRGSNPARFVVLREAWMPAVLVEVGYVSNPQEANRLRSAEYRQAAADGIAEGILSHLREVTAEPTG